MGNETYEEFLNQVEKGIRSQGTVMVSITVKMQHEDGRVAEKEVYARRYDMDDGEARYFTVMTNKSAGSDFEKTMGWLLGIAATDIGALVCGHTEEIKVD